jgi:hypothetical protein
MFKELLISMSLFVLFLAPVQASGINLEMSIDENEKTAYLGDEIYFNLSLTKLGALDDRARIDVSGGPPEWVSRVPDMLYLPSLQQTSASVSFFPTGETTGNFEYTITATSYFSSASVSDKIRLNVLRPLDIEEFVVSISGNDIFLNILLNSKEPADAGMDFGIKNCRGETVKEFSLSANVNGPTLVEESIALPEGILSGDYDVEVTLAGTPVRKDYMFTVLPVHMVTESARKTSSALYDEYEVTITNEGNIREPAYATYRTVPNNDWVTGFITEPDDCFVRGSEKTCMYVFYDLAPGESAAISYRLDYWPVYAAYILVLIAIVSLIFLGMRRATAPVIIKRHVRKRDDKHHVILEIRNPFYHNISNAIVRDWVSPLANVLHHEIDVLRPLIRRSDAGTELIWKLGEIRPKETRIITYPIKALVQGSLKMPRAYIRYNKPNGRIRRIFSKPIIIET